MNKFPKIAISDGEGAHGIVYLDENEKRHFYVEQTYVQAVTQMKQEGLIAQDYDPAEHRHELVIVADVNYHVKAGLQYVAKNPKDSYFYEFNYYPNDYRAVDFMKILQALRDLFITSKCRVDNGKHSGMYYPYVGNIYSKNPYEIDFYESYTQINRFKKPAEKLVIFPINDEQFLKLANVIDGFDEKCNANQVQYNTMALYANTHNCVSVSSFLTREIGIDKFTKFLSPQELELVSDKNTIIRLFLNAFHNNQKVYEYDYLTAVSNYIRFASNDHDKKIMALEEARHYVTIPCYTNNVKKIQCEIEQTYMPKKCILHSLIHIDGAQPHIYTRTIEPVELICDGDVCHYTHVHELETSSDYTCYSLPGEKCLELVETKYVLDDA
jgi:hypothetical protein